MNIYAIIPLVSTIAYVVLIAIIASRPINRLRSVFLLYLALAMLGSFSSFVLHAELFPQNTIYWNRALIMLVLSMPIVYYHFVRAFFNKPAGIRVLLGYLWIVAATIYTINGGFLTYSYVVDGLLYWGVSTSFYIFIAIDAIYFVMSILYLLQGRRNSIDPLARNRIGYLLGALFVWAIFMSTNFIPTMSNYSFDHIGNIGNTLIISYTILRYHLLDIRFVARKVLTFFALTVCYAGIYIGSILTMHSLFPELSTGTSVGIATIVVLILILLNRPITNRIEELIDRLFYRGAYAHRQAMLNFSERAGNILNLSELASQILPAITKALQITQAKLLFQDINSGDFVTQFNYPETEAELDSKFQLALDNPIINWLSKKDAALNMHQIDSIPEFIGLWQAEKEHIHKAKLGLLCPIKGEGNLIGILALGEKGNGNPYTQGDIELVENMARQAGTVILNAHLYARATIRANTDELTGLYNHRHFHERLDQEIARDSRFGAVFSLIMLDLDLFKSYNDTYGHLAGDQILRKIGGYIQATIRNMDMAFRYGGEEFAVILPETRPHDAYIVAERIRRTIQTKTASEAMPVTASVGVASWPADGVLKEEIISWADAALYQAKHGGKNQTCLSSDIAKPEVSRVGMGLDAQPKALSMIYALAATVDTKDHYTYGHSKKVSDYAVMLTEALGLPREKVATIRAAGLLHDIGKIGTPDSILNKKGPLTEEEWQPIKAHPELGVEILRHVPDLHNCLPAIKHHHERYDGKGYPDGLAGNDIPLEARILSIADSYDAITSQRPYRNQLSPKQALDELKSCAGTQFDPQLVEVFCRVIEQTLLKTN